MKLSTDGLRNLMRGWLSQLPKEDLGGFAGIDDDFTQVEINERANELGIRKRCTSQELLDHVYELWCNPKNWKRREKNTLREDWIEWLGEPDYDDDSGARKIALDKWVAAGRPPGLYPRAPLKPITKFNVDVIGGGNSELYPKYTGDANHALAEKCIYRLFEPHELFADNYRLEVVTTPDDSEVIGWCVTVD